MTIARLTRAAVILLTMRLAGTGAAQEVVAAKQAPADCKADLTPESFPKLHALIRPQDSEWRHLRVQWITDVTAARKKAVAEDKPIVVLYTGGAGYNEPLGVC